MKFPCGECHKTFIENVSLKKHFALKHENTCKECEHMAGNDSLLCQHKQTRQKGKTLKCELCEKEFSFLCNPLCTDHPKC